MAPTKSIIDLYANVPVPSLDDLNADETLLPTLAIIKHFYIRHGPKELFGSNYSPLDPILTRQGKRLCLSIEEAEAYNSRGNPFIDKKTLCPGENGFKEAVKSLVEHIFTIRTILDSCIAGVLPMIHLMGIYAHCCSKIMGLKKIDGPRWKLALTFEDRQLEEGALSIEDYVEIKGLLFPFFGFGEESVDFEHTKRCCVCGDYYQAKGAKAIFCSEKCRSRFRSRAAQR